MTSAQATPIDTLAAAPPRRRIACVIAFAEALMLGLASRHWPSALSAPFGKYPGDVLWATMVFFGWAALRPRATTRQVALLAGATAMAIEVGKLWQAPWLVEIRHTTLGHLVLGHVFSWQNLVAYAVGVAVGAALDPLLRPSSRTGSIGPNRLLAHIKRRGSHDA